MRDDLTTAWRAANERLPEGWAVDSLRCASKGLEPQLRSDDWIAVAVHPDGRERQFRAQDPFAALEGLASEFE